jgi:hypothetical protein
MSRPAAAPSRVGIFFKFLLCVLLAGVLGLLAWGLLYGGFSSLRDMRQLERTPRSLAAAVLPGEVTLLGATAVEARSLTAPDSGIETLYYDYTVEREERDSKGKTRWVTVESRTEYVPFLLVDESGPVLVDPSSRVDFETSTLHERRDGDLRYTEHRLDPGTQVFVFGYADTRSRPARIEFDTSGQYSPTISTDGEAGLHAGMSGATLFLLWFGLAVLGFALYALLWGLRVHLITAYLATLTLGMAGALLLLSVQAARDDLQASYTRTARDIAAAEAEIDKRLRTHGARWDGDWAAIGETGGPGSDVLPQADFAVLAHLRERLALQVERTEAVRRQWPERWVAATMQLPTLPQLTAPAGTTHAPPIDDGASSFLATIIATIAFALATLFGWIAFRRIKLKRTIENLATTRTAGVAYGLVELQGKAAVESEGRALTGPLSGQPAVWYHYVVKEKRGSGKNSKWVTIEDRRVDQRFRLVDDEGSLPVDPAQAEAIVTCHTSRRDGNMRYSEHWIAPGTPLYALGSATIDPVTSSSLLLCRGAKEQPFLLTDLGESELMLRKARSGFLWLNLAANAGNAAALALLGASATLDGAGFVTAALVPLFLFALFLAIVMYNDLVTLRQRVRRAWSNIQVSLMKRADLVPQLEAVLKAYMAHESGLHTDLARLRALSQQGQLDQQSAGQLVQAEQGVMTRMAGLSEAYPELAASSAAQHLTAVLVQLENEVALMREGYNNAVERYNSRCQQVPEVIFAKAFAFRPETPFNAELAVHAVPVATMA